MSEIDERDAKKQGQGGKPQKLELKKTVETSQVRQSFARGRSKMVTVEVRKKRTIAPESSSDGRRDSGGDRRGGRDGGRDAPSRALTSHEKAARVRALQDALRVEEERQAAPPPPPPPVQEAEPAPEIETAPVAAADAVAAEALTERAGRVDGPVSESEGAPPATAAEPSPAAEEAAPAAVPADGPTPAAEAALAGDGAAVPAQQAADGAAALPSTPGQPAAESEPRAAQPAAAGKAPSSDTAQPASARPPRPTDRSAKPAGDAAAQAANRKRPDSAPSAVEAATARLRVGAAEEDEGERRGRSKRAPRGDAKRAGPAVRHDDANRRGGRISLSDAMEEGGGERFRSLASVRRAREKERLKQQQYRLESQKVVRDVVIPETITVQELANRMAERGADVIKALMRMGVMATITQSIDADTAELVVTEFGHNLRRVSDADVELGIHGETDTEESLVQRPPVVTVMGHVDHGKTSLLDALRRSDVAAHEAGGITQHIGAYQIVRADGSRITFIDTPGHEAFSQMRARGAKVTDIVVLVVAADDGVMPQTVEAIRHAQAAQVPIIVAVNKIDRPDANPTKIRNELLQHGVYVEDMGGEVQCVEVSAKAKTNLEKLEEAILLQSELLDLKANPNRAAEGVVIETKMERGRGSVATVLVQRGTLRVGDTFVAGREWGRVRGLMNANGAQLEEAGPGEPVEVLGLNGTPAAGDDFLVVDDETRARQVSEYRTRRVRDARVAATKGTLEQMFDRIQSGAPKELALVVKADVHGSCEAIVHAVEKLGNDEVRVNVLHAAVGGINESDVSLAGASNALIIGFNVRANPQAREQAKRDGVEIRYYSIIYDLTDDLRKVLGGMLAPKLRENILGYAEIREVFNISKVGKVAGCMIVEGVVRRGCKVRIVRDDVVAYEGELAQLKRFKDDVKEVREGYDCGISLANYDDIRVGDKIECFELQEIPQEQAL